MNQTIFLRSKQQQQFAINAILATTLDKDKPVTIRITDYKRNLDQNAKFYAMVADISRQVQWCGRWLKPEQWKVLLISGHAVATKQEADVLPGLEGEYVNIRESSAQMWDRTLLWIAPAVRRRGCSRWFPSGDTGRIKPGSLTG
ncbi:recombination protein NinB [Escherichia coli]|uniref:recombination protein NinB n=1 Tax=Escherichia coli TaxID=562 RepID=UPI0032DF541A